MRFLAPIRKRLAERTYYGRQESEEYIEQQFDHWNSQPPTRMAFCDRCGSEVRWFRETQQYSVRTGRPGHTYHLKCPHLHDNEYERARLTERESALPTARMVELLILDAGMHYDSHEYRFRETNTESFDAGALW